MYVYIDVCVKICSSIALKPTKQSGAFCNCMPVCVRPVAIARFYPSEATWPLFTGLGWVGAGAGQGCNNVSANCFGFGPGKVLNCYQICRLSLRKRSTSEALILA